MVIKEVRRQAIQKLKAANVSDTPALDVAVLMKHLWNTDEIGLVLMNEKQAEESKIKEFDSLLDRRMAGEPVAYLCGEKEFMSCRFFVNSGVLIPRGDTECVVEFAASLLNTNEPTILDIGTGSGCIAISLAKLFPHAKVYAVDKSEQALECAKKNADENKVSISFRKMDILTEEPEELFDLIISNPPYIRTDVIRGLETDVKDYEPISALDGGEDGLVFYERIIPLASKYLKKGGKLVFEIGFDQGKEVCALIKQDKSFATPRIIRDLAGRDRGVYTTKEK